MMRKTTTARKIIPFFLAFVLLFSMIVPVSAQTPSLDNFEQGDRRYLGRFHDVEFNDWYFEGVLIAYNYGLMKGTSETSFSPNKTINEAEMAALIARIHSIVHTGTTDFKASDPWYDVYFDYLAENLVDIRDDDPENCYPHRAYFALMVYLAIEDADLELINEVEPGAIPDIENPLDYTYDDGEFWGSFPVYVLYSAGILTGGKNGAFRPNDPITRAEVATIIARLVEPDLRVGFTLEKKSSKAPSASSSSSSSSSASKSSSSDGTQSYTPSNSTTYVINRSTRVFHKSSCFYVGQMKESNKMYVSASREDLLSQDFTACKHCHP